MSPKSREVFPRDLSGTCRPYGVLVFGCLNAPLGIGSSTNEADDVVDSKLVAHLRARLERARDIIGFLDGRPPKILYLYL